MKKKIISLLLVAVISSTALISCRKAETNTNSNTQKSTTEQNASTDSSDKDSNIVGENNKPTVEITKIATISDFKDKTTIEKLLGKPISEDSTNSVYEKDNYTFEVTYSESKCNKFKIIPKSEMKYPANGANLLKLIGIDAGKADKISPSELEWNNKFDTFKINVVSNNEPDGKIVYAEVILVESSK